MCQKNDTGFDYRQNVIFEKLNANEGVEQNVLWHKRMTRSLAFSSGPEDK